MLGEVALPNQLQSFVEHYWQRLSEHGNYSELGLSELFLDKEFVQEVNTVWAASEFVANSQLSDPLLIKYIFARRTAPDTDYLSRLELLLSPLKNADFSSGLDQLKAQIRSFHKLEFLLIIWRDICGYDDVHEVCDKMSELADAALHVALDILHGWSSKQWGVPVCAGVPQSLVVIGMGKLGANELNVSSDIDLIFAYPEAGKTETEGEAAQSITNQQYFTKLGQRLIDVIDSSTEDGFVFRTDMRLRPYGSEGALTLNFDAMEDYYQNQGRDWERYALIKARAVAGDIERGAILLKRLRPFIYRRYLDFAMFDSLRSMKAQINKQARRGKQSDDIKLGSGGIREIEFIIQALQLVYGGKNISLQQQSITKAAENLILGEYLPAEVAGELIQAYEFLRKLEHRLQAFANQQTQTLPGKSELQIRIAFAMGFENWENLISALQQQRKIVSSHFQQVLGSEADSQAEKRNSADWEPLWKMELAEEDAIALMESSGFENARESYNSMVEFRKDKKFLSLATDSRKRVNVFFPVLLDAVSESEKPSLCLSRVMPLIEAVSRRTAYLVLLLENPQALNQLVLYCTVSPFISSYLSKFPVLLDELLHVLDAPPEKPKLADELQMQLLRIDATNFEEQLNSLRYFKQSHLLQVAAAEVSGKMPLMKVSDYLTSTAEVILEAVLALSWEHLVAKHGYPIHLNGDFGEPGFAIVGYGKLGGIELSYNSDLDLVFLHDAALEKDTVVTENQTSINSRAFYIKLAQRIIVMLGTYTLAGELYEVDMRLRPSGESGLLVSSIKSFEEYQQGNAWTWEHQALVRARGVAGNKLLLEKFSGIRARILGQQRDNKALAEEVTSMRNKMRKELSAKSKTSVAKEAFEIKQSTGGIVDIEFLVQYLVLAYSFQCEKLLIFTDNFRILEAAQSCQLLKQEDMGALINAYLDLRSASHLLALQQEGVISNPVFQKHQNAVATIWDNVFGFLA